MDRKNRPLRTKWALGAIDAHLQLAASTWIWHINNPDPEYVDDALDEFLDEARAWWLAVYAMDELRRSQR